MSPACTSRKDTSECHITTAGPSRLEYDTSIKGTAVMTAAEASALRARNEKRVSRRAEHACIDRGMI